MEKNKKDKNELTKLFWILLIIISIILIVCVALGFFFFSNRKVEVITEKKNGGDLVLNYSSNVNGLSIVGATPMADDVAIKNMTEEQYFDFSVESSLNNAGNIEYEISLIRDETTATINDKDIRIYLEKEESGTYIEQFGPKEFSGIKKKTELGSKKGSMVIVKAKKKNSETDNYRLRMWLASDAATKTGNYSVEININGKAK